jgi:protein SCO1/2
MDKVLKGWLIKAVREPAENGDYHMSHTASLLMVGSDGRLKGLLPYGIPDDEAVEKIRLTLLPSPS